MDFGIKRFGETARKLAHNPLGIIALFIVLVYAIAALVMIVSGSELPVNERVILIWFLVLFPVLILIAFVWLVSRHHEKLYAPADYRDDSSFLKTLGVESQRKRIESEIRDMEEGQETEADRVDKTVSKESTKLLSRQELRPKYFLAEDLVFRKLESEFGVQIRRNSILGVGAATIELDGVFSKNERINIIEVKFLHGRYISMVGIERFLLQLVSYKIELKAKMIPLGAFSVLLAIVAEIPKSEQHNLYHRIKRTADRYDLPVKIRLFDFDELKKEFGIEN